MRDNYVNNMEEILSANQTQKNKIEFLERERVKRDNYLDDLQQNLFINKQTIKQLNKMRSNDQTVAILAQQSLFLTNKIKLYYEEYQNINAVLLMEKQLRLEDKHFYQERILEFQNRIVDLRKYLQDKEESFTSVVLRLKKYQELSQPTVDEKLILFKKQIAERSINQFVMDLIKEKNYYKNAFEKEKEQFIIFNEVKSNLISLYPGAKQVIDLYKAKNGSKIAQAVNNQYVKVQEQKDKKNGVLSKRIEPNKQLLRLLKKQKLNNQLLEQALNEAIQKNEELIIIKNNLQRMISKLQKKYQLLNAENSIISLRLSQYDRHFSRYLTHNRRYYEQGDYKGLDYIVKSRLKEYAATLSNYLSSEKQLYLSFSQKLKQDVDKWSVFICDAHSINKSIKKQQLFVKSCSVPQLLTVVQLQGQCQEKFIIEQF